MGKKMINKAEEPETLLVTSAEVWRNWLLENHASKSSVWLLFNKKNSGGAYVSWSDAVDEALCFGWIDSKRVPLDEYQFRQIFTRRKAGSTWSKINKAKIERLIKEGKMMPAGLASIALAKKNGSWNLLDEVEELILPTDLDKEMAKYPGAKDFYLSLSPSLKKMLLHRVAMAKREETKQKRIADIAAQMHKKQKPV